MEEPKPNQMIEQLLKEPLGDPTTGAATITLSDGVSRVLKFDFRALRILEELTGVPFSRSAQILLSANSITSLLYAGLYGDAKARGEQWSLERVVELVDLAAVPTLMLAIAWALRVALQRMEGASRGMLGELMANGRQAKPSPGVGRPH